MEIKTEYRRDLQHTWMILSGGDIPEKDAYAVRMLTENRIRGLVPCKAVSLDGGLRFYYDISSRHALRTFLETEPVTQELLRQILGSLASVMERLSEFLLDPDGLLLDPAYLFLDAERCEVQFCWYPGKGMQFREQTKLLGSALLAQLDQADRTGVVMGYQFYQRCESGELTPAAIRGVMHTKQPEREERPVTKEEIERAAVLDSFFDDAEEEEHAFSSVRQRIRAWFSKRRKKKEVYDPESEQPGLVLGEPAVEWAPAEQPAVYTTVTENLGSAESMQTVFPGNSGGAETMVLTPEMLLNRGKKTWVLRIREGRGKERDVPLTGTIYFVGKKESGATLQLASPAVSRLHAKLERIGESWFLEDMNSRNGCRRERTQPNGTKTETLLQPQEAVTLQEGDVIWFADVMCQVILQT